MEVKNLIIKDNLGSEFEIGTAVANKITVKNATDLVAGKVALAVSSNYPQNTNNIDAATPAFVKTAIDAALIGSTIGNINRKEVYQSLTFGSVITLQYTPSNTIDLLVYRNGDLINDYFLVNNVLTFITPFGSSTGATGFEEITILYTT